MPAAAIVAMSAAAAAASPMSVAVRSARSPDKATAMRASANAIVATRPRSDTCAIQSLLGHGFVGIGDRRGSREQVTDATERHARLLFLHAQVFHVGGKALVIRQLVVQFSFSLRSDLACALGKDDDGLVNILGPGGKLVDVNGSDRHESS